MTTLELKLNLPDLLAREAQAAGLLTPDALAELLKDAMRRHAGQEEAGQGRASNGTDRRSDAAQLSATVHTLLRTFSATPAHGP